MADMCRNIRTLANFEPPATSEEIRASALQFVRKLSGSSKPSKANEAVFARAVDEVTAAAERLIRSLHTSAAPRDRAAEAAKARARSAERYRPTAAPAEPAAPTSPGGRPSSAGAWHRRDNS